MIYKIIGVIIVFGTIIVIHRVQKRNQRKRIWKEKNSPDNPYKIEGSGGTERLKDKNNVILKIQMYFVSLWLLFLLLIPLTLSVPDKGMLCTDVVVHKIIKEILRINILPIIFVVLALLGLVAVKQIQFRLKGTKEIPVKIQVIDSKNYEYLTFLTTYIIPLVCINMDQIRYVIVLFALLIIIGAIFVKSDFYLGNPTLALMGYRLYNISYKIGECTYEKMVISKDKIHEGDYVEYIVFDKHAWYVRRSK